MSTSQINVLQIRLCNIHFFGNISGRHVGIVFLLYTFSTCFSTCLLRVPLCDCLVDSIWTVLVCRNLLITFDTVFCVTPTEFANCFPFSKLKINSKEYARQREGEWIHWQRNHTLKEILTLTQYHWRDKLSTDISKHALSQDGIAVLLGLIANVWTHFEWSALPWGSASPNLKVFY